MSTRDHAAEEADETAERRARRAVLEAARLLGLAVGAHLRLLRTRQNALRDLEARLAEAETRARLATEIAQLLRSRFERIPEGRKPYFTPAQRFRILEIKSLLGWSARDIAREFLLCTNTILNWQIAADPASRTVGVRVTPVPPVRKAADVVVAVAQLMAKMGFGGIDLSSRILARAGWRLSARSIGRFRREKPQPPVAPAPAPAARPPRPVKARFVHHVWMMDVTEVKQFLGPSLHLAAVFDAFSRVPLALRVFEGEMPTARDMGQLLRAAVRAFTRPRHVVTDLGDGVHREGVRLGGEAPRSLSALRRQGLDQSHRPTRAVLEDDQGDGSPPPSPSAVDGERPRSPAGSGAPLLHLLPAARQRARRRHPRRGLPWPGARASHGHRAAAGRTGQPRGARATVRSALPRPREPSLPDPPALVTPSRDPPAGGREGACHCWRDGAAPISGPPSISPRFEARFPPVMRPPPSFRLPLPDFLFRARGRRCPPSHPESRTLTPRGVNSQCSLGGQF